MIEPNSTPWPLRVSVALALSAKSPNLTACPDDGEIAAFVDAAAERAGYDSFLEHICDCERCYEIWRDTRAAVLDLRVPGDEVEATPAIRNVLTALASAASKPVGACLDDNLIAAYVDNALNGDERETVEAHLASCQPCYQTWSVVAMAVAEDDAVPEAPPAPKTAEVVAPIAAVTEVPTAPTVVAQQGQVGSVSQWLRDNVWGKPGAFGGGLATAAVLVMAILVALPQKQGAGDDMQALYGDVSSFGQPALLAINAPPGTTVRRSAGPAGDSELAFRAGIRAAFGKIVSKPNAKWQESLKSMEDVVPQCMLGGGVKACSPAVQAGYGAGEWMALAYTSCEAGKIEGLAPALGANLKRIADSFGNDQTVGGFADAVRSVAHGPVDARQICKLANDWVG